MAGRFGSVDAYIAGADADVRPILERVRRVIHEAVPDAGEKISYGMPMVTLAGQNLVSFAAWARHIGVYPLPDGDAQFQREIEPYRDAKATGRFPLSEPIPYELIARIAALLASERIHVDS